MNEITPGKYQHFKGETYQVIAVAKHTEKLEDLVIYKGPDGKIWARPKLNFVENVYVNGQKVPRFKPL